MNVPLCRPYLPPETRKELDTVLDSGQLTEGSATRELERLVANAAGCSHGMAVPSCTVGLEISLRCMGIGPGHEVLVPDYTFPATALAVLNAGAVPVLIDVAPDTMLMDMDKAAKAITTRTKAVVPVSIFGNPLDYDRLEAFRAEHGLPVLEDAACALGSSHVGRPAGSVPNVSVFSFHPRKLVTTGEGGMIVTNDSELAARIRSYGHFGMEMSGGMQREGVCFARPGTNAKLSNVQAALGLPQLRRLEEILRVRRGQAERYRALLHDKPGIALPQTTAKGDHSWQSFCIFVHDRDAVLNQLRQRGVEAQIGTYALHMHPCFVANCRILSPPVGSRTAFDTCLALPIYHSMTDAEQQFVVEQLLDVAAR